MSNLEKNMPAEESSMKQCTKNQKLNKQQVDYEALLNNLTQMILSLADALVPERKLYAYQYEFGAAIILALLCDSSEEITALFARQAGKTETVARVVVALSIILPWLARQNYTRFGRFQSGLWIGIFAPVKEQAFTTFERIREILETPQSQTLLQDTEYFITEATKGVRLLSNGSSIRISSAAPGSNIESKTLHLAIVEEAQDVSSFKIRKSIEPMLTATAGTLVLVGTANGQKSLFWETIENNRKRQYQEPDRRLHFEYDWKVVIRYNRFYRAFLNKKFLSRGRGWIESDFFKMAYACMFILERGQFLTTTRLLELEALGQNLPRGPYDATNRCVIPASTVAGIDWGKSSDSTVVTIIAKYDDFCQIVDWLEIIGDDYDTQFGIILDFLKRFPTLERILSETNGVGDPMTDRLKRATQLGHIDAVVTGFVASESNNSDGYKNLMIDFIHANRLLIPADISSRCSSEYQKFIAQLTSTTKEWRGSILRVQGEAHDDYVSSLMIAYWAASRLSTSDIFRQFFCD